VNVAAKRLGLIPKNYPLRTFNLGKIFQRVHSNQGARRTVFFTRISLTANALRVERSVLAKIALDGYNIVGRR
jgi:hypothetical protein